MGFINLSEKTISAKLVYYGPGAGGKTTSLQAVHQVFCPHDEVQLVSIATEDDSTLLFDFLPIDLGHVEGFKIRIQGFTVPGQPKYKRMRKYVLRGADAVVFVVDSQASRLDENKQALDSMLDNLRSNGIDPEKIPIIVQYNKRDLDDVLPEGELDRHFKWRPGIEAFPSIAHEGRGVFETFVHAAGMLVEAKSRAYGLGRGDIQPETVAEGARQRLWELYNKEPDGTPTEGEDRRVAVTVPHERDEPMVRSSGTEVEPPEPEPETDVEVPETALDAEERTEKERLDRARLEELFTDEELDVDLEPSADAPFDPSDEESLFQDAPNAAEGKTGKSKKTKAKKSKAKKAKKGGRRKSDKAADAEPEETEKAPALRDVESVDAFADIDDVIGPPAKENPEDDEPDLLLEEVIQTNVELAQHFGSLDEYKRLLEKKTRELVQVAQNTVHDLNRPLSAIKLMMSSARRGLFGEAPPPLQEAIDTSLDAVRQMERLINELLDSSRLDYDGVKLEFKDIDMTLLVAEVVRCLKTDIGEAAAVCVIEPLPIIKGDEWALTKAFTNLIGNALQYIHPDRRPHINVCADVEDDRYVFIIEDNGIGIPSDDLDRLFRRFERGSNTSGISGSGLGLHIVREAIYGHGGTVWVESQEGGWTRFMVALPFEPVMPPHSTVTDVVTA